MNSRNTSHTRWPGRPAANPHVTQIFWGASEAYGPVNTPLSFWVRSGRRPGARRGSAGQQGAGDEVGAERSEDGQVQQTGGGHDR